MAGLATVLGSGAMTNTIAELEGAACILAIGTSTTDAHPIVGLQVKRAARKGAKLIVANPKEVDLCRFADIHLPIRPGSDVALLMGMAKVIIEAGLHDQRFIAERCEDFEAFQQSLAAFSPEFVAGTTGVPWERIVQAARLYAGNKPAAILYCMGITQHSHGTDNVLGISNLALITGNLGVASGGVNPLRGQNNVQGACDMGLLPDVFTGYQKVSNPAAREQFERAWGCALSGTPGLTHTEIFDAAHAGTVKSLYLVGENPLLTEANSGHAREALGRLEFFIAQDIFLTETAQLADVVLPAASFAEKDGTFVNTERRVQRVRRVIPPVGASRPDWQIVCAVAKAMGAEGFDFSGPEAVFTEIASLTPSYAGISYARLERGGIQWPCPTPEHPGTPVLHTGRFSTPSGKAKLAALSYRPPAEVPDDAYPLVLTTDRSLFQFHSTMTRRAEGLDRLHGEELVCLSPVDADTMGIADGQLVEVASRRGSVRAKAKVTGRCQPGVVSMSFHFSECPTNLLTSAALDPVAKTPETKVCAVRVTGL